MDKSYKYEYNPNNLSKNKKNLVAIKKRANLYKFCSFYSLKSSYFPAIFMHYYF